MEPWFLIFHPETSESGLIILTFFSTLECAVICGAFNQTVDDYGKNTVA